MEQKLDMPGRRVVVQCCLCRRVATDNGKWGLSNPAFPDPSVVYSHGYCPECFARVCAEMALDMVGAERPVAQAMAVHA
ncbi:MAG: hypothetical protein A3K19_01380 [Lentisphaerae bacterium RIFOXYB12_FULL_65_16]|nr:MAG: hypothetical protein A3K18_06260 [Lentisphaerae bacterium RIFOXYA12_64_32]OGV92549.1 MAG: hypothetical protein A3K19_01380 [Lentisphaerae bacterium RIFOXYB12_FULL_65_16]